MIYNTILTIKGTTTIPVEIRNKLGLKPGMSVTFAEDSQGNYLIKRSLSLEEIRKLNKATLQKSGRRLKSYESGIGFTEFVVEKYQEELHD